MGMSTDGILFYGVLINEDEAPWDADEFNWDKDVWEKTACELLGFADKDELYSLEKELGIVLGIHCSYEYPMYFVSAKASVQTANRGYPIEPDFTVQPEWEDKIRDFCGKLNIPCDDLKWHLASCTG